MAKWCIGIIHGRKAMHECGWPKGGFSGITEIDVARKIGRKSLRIGQRQFVEQIVRMLPIVQWLIVPGFARLKKQWITAAVSIPISQFGASIRSSPRRVLTLV